MNMRISPINNYIAFQKLKTHTKNNFKVVEEFGYPSFDSESYGMYNVKTELEDDNNFGIKINSDNSLWPISSLVGTTSKNKIYIDFMKTELKYRNQGLGSVLHLISIIEMLENNIPEICLDATPKAMPYHSKLKYYPDSEWARGLECNLEDISEFAPEYANEINNLINSDKTSQEKTKIGKKILYNFIQKALTEYSDEELKQIFNSYTPMKLTREFVLKNREFYNDQFKKHHIDYEISPEDV